MRRFLPSRMQLMAFEAAALHQSFSRAAEDLNLTQSAISRQVRTLEDMLGTALFERVRQRVLLTEVGHAYLQEVQVGMAAIERATIGVRAGMIEMGVLNLAILPTFGMRWLIPRLPRFNAGAPSVTINLITRHEPFEFATSGRIDAAIHFGPATWPSGWPVVMEKLMEESTIAVCSPSLLSGQIPLATPRDLAQHTLLQHSTRTAAWTHWLAGAGITDIDGTSGPRFEYLGMSVQAAVAGLGVAVMPRFLVERELETGELVIPAGFPEVPSEHAYYLVYPESKARQRPMRAFSAWLNEEARSFVAR